MNHQTFRSIMIQYATLLRMLLLGLVLLLVQCTPTEQIQRDEEPDVETVMDAPADPEEDLEIDVVDQREFELAAARLQQDRSRLSDAFVGLSHDMPEFYERVSEHQGDPRQGYRIQILATTQVAEADTVRRQYEEWIEASQLDGKPHSYIDYRQPTYRVRVGDFHSRDRALTFSERVKRQFPAAWVVYSPVEPDRVLPDSIRFEPVMQPAEPVEVEASEEPPVEELDEQSGEN